MLDGECLYIVCQAVHSIVGIGYLATTVLGTVWYSAVFRPLLSHPCPFHILVKYSTSTEDRAAEKAEFVDNSVSYFGLQKNSGWLPNSAVKKRNLFGKNGTFHFGSANVAGL